MATRKQMAGWGTATAAAQRPPMAPSRQGSLACERARPWLPAEARLLVTLCVVLWPAHLPWPSLPACRSRLEQQFDLLGELGRGAFGCALKARRRSDGAVVCLKVLDQSSMGATERRMVRCWRPYALLL